MLHSKLCSNPLIPSFGVAKKLVQPKKPAQERRPNETAIHPQRPDKIPVVSEMANSIFLIFSAVIRLQTTLSMSGIVKGNKHNKQ